MSDPARNYDSAADSLETMLGEELREGLLALPTPAVSADFEERVLRALEAPTVPWWHAGWMGLRPVLVAGACSLVGSLVLLRFAASLPATATAPSHGAALAASSATGSSVDADTLIELAARRRAALRAVLSASPAPQVSPTAPERRSEAAPSPLA